MKRKPLSWEDLYGHTVLHGVSLDARHPFKEDASGVALDVIGGTILAFEDPCDGYRSCCAAPIVTPERLYALGANYDHTAVPVTISCWEVEDAECYGKPSGIKIVDRRNGAIIALLGTANTDDYYPSFVFDWRPQNIADNRTAAARKG